MGCASWFSSKRLTSETTSSSTQPKMAPVRTSDTTSSRTLDVPPTPTPTPALARQADYATLLSDVLVVGAGPAGLMLADNLVRFGIKTRIMDDRPNRTETGRADGIQPKSIETLRQMRLADTLLRQGVKVYDIAFWKSTSQKSMHRTAREIHYPPVVDLVDPYILLVHQGMVEDIFINDLMERGVSVERSTAFTGLEYTPQKLRPLTINCNSNGNTKRVYGTRYLVGCDGAHSVVRKQIPNSRPVGASSDAIWGVIDGVLDTNFPDLWSKVAVHSEALGSVLMIPRERNLTRLYIELKPGAEETGAKARHTQEHVQKRAQEIMHPYRLRWTSVEWFGRYQVGQRVATHFADPNQTVFIAGDASHTHSPKAAQGMNTSMHDSWNLAWKLNLAVRGLAKPSLLQTYEEERKKIAEDLINFDYEHSNAFAAGDPVALAANFAKNVAFISGYGVSYDANVLNVPTLDSSRGALEAGYLLPPAKVTRFIDVNPVDIQTDIPALGQFRIYIFAHDLHAAMPFLDTISVMHQSKNSYVGRVTDASNASHTIQPPLAAPHDQFVCPERYTAVSGTFTYALVTDMNRNKIEISQLPPILRDSRWSFYFDDCADKDTQKKTCIDKWLGGLGHSEVAVVNVRPDGYVGTWRRFRDGSRQNGLNAVTWMDDYYSQFLFDV